MKKVILFLMLLVACTSTNVKIIDGCQYIETTSINGDGSVVTLTHKGDCNNPIHQDKGYVIYKHIADSLKAIGDTTKK